MRIKNITKVDPREVYAVQTSTGTFIADGLAMHNCYHCNLGLKGNWVPYERAMITLYGKEKVEELKQLHKGTNKHMVRYSAQDYLDIEEKFKKKLEELGGFPG